MDSAKFINLLENPFNIDPEIIRQLKILAESHPYSQPLAYVNARFLLEQNNPEFEIYSRHANALAVNRKIYYNYISGKLNPLRPKPASFDIDLNEGSKDENSAASQNNLQHHEVEADSFQPKGKDYEHLIEKFIKDEPRIPPPRKDLPKQNLAEKPIGPIEELVTETLANVYLHQGFTSEAIDIFEKLSLKNPEKSSYFAKKIEDIKNQLET